MQAAVPSAARLCVGMLSAPGSRTPTDCVLSSEPSPVRVLLLCAHIVSHLARASPIPQTTTATSTGTAAKQCPALAVTWPAVDDPLSKEQWWEPGGVVGRGLQGEVNSAWRDSILCLSEWAQMLLDIGQLTAQP